MACIHSTNKTFSVVSYIETLTLLFEIITIIIPCRTVYLTFPVRASRILCCKRPFLSLYVFIELFNLIIINSFNHSEMCTKCF